MLIADAGVPGVDQLIQLANLGGFVFAAVVLLLLIYLGWQTFSAGKLVPLSLHEQVVGQLTTANAALRTDLQAATGELGRLADLLEKQGQVMVEHDRDMREHVAKIEGSVQTALAPRRRA